MKVSVATPLYDKLTAEYTQSLFYAGLDCAKRDIELVPALLLCSCFVDVGRSVLVKLFLDSDCSHLFFVDSDIGYEPHAIAGLVQGGVPVAAGVYRKREDKVRYAAQIDEPFDFRGPWIRVNRVATGFMCIERSVLEEMSRRAHTCEVSSHGKVPMVFRTDTRKDIFVGEDYCFCDDYNALYEEGVFAEPIWAYPDITFNHDGYVGNLHNALLQKNVDYTDEDLPRGVG